jgi:antitoxin component of MazEF toxin-antitoxin module
MTTKNLQDPEDVKVQNNQVVFIPKRFLDFLELTIGSEMTLQMAIGRHGPFFYVANKEQQERWINKKGG